MTQCSLISNSLCLLNHSLIHKNHLRLVLKACWLLCQTWEVQPGSYAEVLCESEEQGPPSVGNVPEEAGTGHRFQALREQAEFAKGLVMIMMIMRGIITLRADWIPAL